MRIRLVMIGFALAGSACSGSGSGGNQQSGPYNDSATGVALMDEHPFGTDEGRDRIVQLENCSATLMIMAEGPPVPPRAQQMRALAIRLHEHAVRMGGRANRPEAAVTRIRDDALAARLQLRRNRPDIFNRLIGPSAEACDVAEIMTDDELSGAAAGSASNTALPEINLLDANLQH